MQGQGRADEYVGVEGAVRQGVSSTEKQDGQLEGKIGEVGYWQRSLQQQGRRELNHQQVENVYHGRARRR